MTVLLYSGGIDSTVLLYDLLDDGGSVAALGFDYGQPHRVELDHAERICSTRGVRFEVLSLDLGFLGRTIDGLIFPNRNTIFVSVAAGYAMSHGHGTVSIAPHLGDAADFPDCRPRWVTAMHAVLLQATDNVVGLSAPYLHLSKAQIVARGRDLGVPFDETWSCYEGGTEPCGDCQACVSRGAAGVPGG